MHSRFTQRQKPLIIGHGSIGKRHVRNLELLGVKNFVFLHHAHALQKPHHYTRLSDALRERPTWALIANPTTSHVSTAIVCARAGLDLFIEKPLGDTLKGTRELQRLVRQQKLVAMTGFDFRFHPQLIRAKKLLHTGAIGKVVSARISVGQWLPDWHPGEDYRRGYAARRNFGGGALLTLIHEIDDAYWLFGMPNRVTALVGHVSHLKIDVEDVAEVLMEHRGGTLSSVHLDYVQRTLRRTAEIIGEEGTILWDYVERTLKLYRAKTEKWQVWHDPAGFERNTMFVDEMRHFLHCLETRKTPQSSLKDGIDTLRIVLAAHKAAAKSAATNL